jgi:hypothetical protein
MGRPRHYASNAERQRAFRRRLDTEWARVDRGALERHHARLQGLQEAIRAAAAAGDTTARRCSAAGVDTMLEKLTAHFAACASAPAGSAAAHRPTPDAGSSPHAARSARRRGQP